MITKGLRDSGLVVNESKTEICLFHRNDQQKININVCGTLVKTKSFMNVLGVTFDSKLNWSIHITNCINKAKKSLYALRQLKPFFSPTQMRMLLDSYFYSMLYYNAQIWLTPELSTNLKHDLLAVSAMALRTCINFQNRDVSFINLHKQCQKSTPEQFMMYQLSINAYKSINENVEIKFCKQKPVY